MNYLSIYIKIIENRKLNPINGYTETHHILPKSLGGNNDKDNLVNLTAREHFICHLLLTKIYHSKLENAKMVRAFMMMFVMSSNQKRYYSSREYEKLKIRYRLIVSEHQTGDRNSQFNTKWISDPLTGNSSKINKDRPIPEGWILGRNKKYQVCDICSSNFIKRYISNTCSKICEKQLKAELKTEYWKFSNEIQSIGV